MNSDALPSNVTSQASVKARIKVWLEGIPFVTRIVFFVCVAIYLLELIFGSVTKDICLSPNLVKGNPVECKKMIPRLLISNLFIFMFNSLSCFYITVLPPGNSSHRHEHDGFPSYGNCDRAQAGLSFLGKHDCFIFLSEWHSSRYYQSRVILYQPL